MDRKIIESKNLLFNRKEYIKFKSYIAKDADKMFSLVEEKVQELHSEFPFRENFDKKSFIDDFIRSEQLENLMHLN